MRKVLDGVLFGLGFGVTFLTMVYFGFFFVSAPQMFESETFEVSPNSVTPGSLGGSTSLTERSTQEHDRSPFYELDIDDKIEYASVIALAEYRPASDGAMRAVITDILKKEEDVVFYYEVGDEYANGSYYPQENADRGDGLVIFFTGSPASTRSSMTYRGERITGLGDMPLKLLRQKCESPST